MRKRSGLLLVFALLLVACQPPGEGGSGPEATTGEGAGAVTQPSTSITVHYLGHAAFLLSFGDGPTVLTDYGESNAYGLDSPVYPLGEVVPELVTLSHEHADHAGGELPEGVGLVLRGEDTLSAGGLTIIPIPTYEGSLEAPDNSSFLFEFAGLKVLHLGDCQGLMLEADTALIHSLYPDRYDLVLLPIGFTSDILAEAAAFATLLDAARIVPMHYWSPADRDAFLTLMEGQTDALGRAYEVRGETGAAMTLTASSGNAPPLIIGLTPAPPG